MVTDETAAHKSKYENGRRIFISLRNKLLKNFEKLKLPILLMPLSSPEEMHNTSGIVLKSLKGELTQINLLNLR